MRDRFDCLAWAELVGIVLMFCVQVRAHIQPQKRCHYQLSQNISALLFAQLDVLTLIDP